MSTHFIHKCQICEGILAQCRCPSETKAVQYLPSTDCPNCKDLPRHGEPHEYMTDE